MRIYEFLVIFSSLAASCYGQGCQIKNMSATYEGHLVSTLSDGFDLNNLTFRYFFSYPGFTVDTFWNMRDIDNQQNQSYQISSQSDRPACQYESFPQTYNVSCPSDDISVFATVQIVDSLKPTTKRPCVVVYGKTNFSDLVGSLPFSIQNCTSPITNLQGVKIDLWPKSLKYQETAVCSCANNGSLRHHNGAEYTQNASCNATAGWEGCIDAECWTAATNVTLYQGNYYENATANFECTFEDGFPSNTSVQYTIGKKIVDKTELLDRKFYGEPASCQVLSLYTLLDSSEGKSPSINVTVFFTPKIKNPVSDIRANVSTVISINFQASDRNGNVTYTFSRNGTIIDSGNATIDKSIPNYLFNSTIELRNESDSGEYIFKAYSQDPSGFDMVQFKVVYGSENTGMGENNGLSTSIIIGISVAAGGIILLIIVFFIIRRYRGKKESDGIPSNKNKEFAHASSSGNSEKEERINPIYGSAVQSGKEERANPLYGTTNVDLGDATYTTVVKPQKKEKSAKLEKEEKTNPLYSPVTSNDNTAEEAYAAVDKRKKKGGNENPVFTVDTSGDTYTEVVKKNKKKNAPTEPDVMYAEVQKKNKKNKGGVGNNLHGS